MRSHGAVASLALDDKDLVRSVLEDFETAEIDEPLRETLRFLAKLTRRPTEVTAADAEAVRRAGVGDAALRDAIRVCALFQLITRVADALKFEIPSDEDFDASARFLLKRGYV